MEHLFFSTENIFSFVCNTFIDFTSKTAGGAIGINLTKANIEVIECTFLRCASLGNAYYNRDEIGGGAIAFNGQKSLISKSCYSFISTINKNKGTAVFICTCVENCELKYSSFKNIVGGDGPYTLDSTVTHNHSMNEINISHSNVKFNSALAINTNFNITYSCFVSLESTSGSFFSGYNVDFVFVHIQSIKSPCLFVSPSNNNKWRLSNCNIIDGPASLTENNISIISVDCYADEALDGFTGQKNEILMNVFIQCKNYVSYCMKNEYILTMRILMLPLCITLREVR